MLYGPPASTATFGRAGWHDVDFAPRVRHSAETCEMRLMQCLNFVYGMRRLKVCSVTMCELNLPDQIIPSYGFAS